MLKSTPPDVPPPGEGFTTVTVALPAVWRSVALTCAVIVVEFVYDVDRGVPFHITVDDVTKFDPPAVVLIPAPPAAAEAGLIETSEGIGFDGGLIVKFTPLDVPPPGEGFTTVTVALPAVCRSAALTCAVITNEFACDVERGVPFHITVDDVMKFDPLAMMFMPAVPAAVEAGLIEVNEGAGFGIETLEPVPLPHATRPTEVNPRAAARPMNNVGGRIFYFLENRNSER
jgi:hypothetical protein